mmetsp:Transcript_168762/g.542387  ORF Transcript_168762/g.542387 Transcript_168762/m.542387 type:complete len:373 (+) Transcript_168762:274-1392(+)
MPPGRGHKVRPPLRHLRLHRRWGCHRLCLRLLDWRRVRLCRRGSRQGNCNGWLDRRWRRRCHRLHVRLHRRRRVRLGRRRGRRLGRRRVRGRRRDRRLGRRLGRRRVRLGRRRVRLSGRLSRLHPRRHPTRPPRLDAIVRVALHGLDPGRVVDDVLLARRQSKALEHVAPVEGDGVETQRQELRAGHGLVAVGAHGLNPPHVNLGFNDEAAATDSLHVGVLGAGREVDGTATDAGLARVEFTNRQDALACCFGGLVEQCHHVGPAGRVGLGPVLQETRVLHLRRLSRCLRNLLMLFVGIGGHLGKLRLGTLLDPASALQQRHVAAPLGVAAAVADVVLLQQRLRHVVADSEVGGGGGRLRGGPGKAREQEHR